MDDPLFQNITLDQIKDEGTRKRARVEEVGSKKKKTKGIASCYQNMAIGRAIEGLGILT